MTMTVSDRVAEVATYLLERLPSLEADLVRQMLDEIPELRGDEKVRELLTASVRENVAVSLDVMVHGIDVSEIVPPPAAAEYARRLAQRGVPVEALLRAYRLGHGRHTEWWLRVLESLGASGPETVQVMSVAIDLGFRYVDRISEQVLIVYFGERERWLQSTSAARGALVRSLLAGDPSELPAVESALGYRLGRWHVGIIAWVDGSPPVGEGLMRLDRMVARLTRSPDEASLVVLADERSLWAWLPARSGESLGPDVIDRALAECDVGVRVAIGDPSEGLAGFRLTHRQALLTRDVAAVAGASTDAVTTYADSGILAFLVSNLEIARAWVRCVLGGLAADDAAAASLRETVQVFLETQGSYAKTASRLHVHKNTVHYRLGKAHALRGRPLDDDRMEMEVALTACQRLGSAVLHGASGG